MDRLAVQKVLENRQQKLRTMAVLLAAKLGAPEYAARLGLDVKTAGRVEAATDTASSLYLLARVAKLHKLHARLIYDIATQRLGRSLEDVLPDKAEYLDSIYIEGFGGGFNNPGERLEKISYRLNLDGNKVFGECIQKLEGKGLKMDVEVKTHYSAWYNKEIFELDITNVNYSEAAKSECMKTAAEYAESLAKTGEVADLLGGWSPIGHAYLGAITQIQNKLNDRA